MTEEGGVKVAVREVSSVLRELRFEIPWDRVQGQIEQRYEELKRSARNIRGFRKGKAPRWLLEQMFGPQVTAEVSQHLVTDELAKALVEHKFSPVTIPEIEPEEMQKGQPLAFTARVEVRPTIETLNYEGLELKRPVREVTESEVDAEIEKLREETASLRAPEPARPAQAGDVLVVDYDVRREGKEEPERTREGQQVELGKGMLQDHVEQALLGANEGDERTVPLELPQAGEDDSKQQPSPLSFVIRVREIREKVLPELDDEFAKDVSGEHESLADLRRAIRETLEKKAETVTQNMLRDQALEALCDANPIEVPPSLVEQQAREAQSEVARLLQLDLEKLPFDEGQMERIRKESERKVRVAFLLNELAEKAGLSVTDEDLEARLKEVAESTGRPLPKVKAELSRQRDGLEQLRIGLLQQRVVEHLLSKASIIDVPADEGQTPGPGETPASEAKPEPEAAADQAVAE